MQCLSGVNAVRDLIKNMLSKMQEYIFNWLTISLNLFMKSYDLSLIF